MATWAERIGRRIKLRDLHVLMEVAQWGSMAKAAQHLGISTPVVSKTITDIERVLGVALLDRGPRGIEPTPYGRALIRRGIAVFDELKQGVEEIGFLADPMTGEVRIGSTEPLAAGLVPAVIEKANRLYPQMSFQVVQADFSTLQHALRAREIDLMIGRPAQPISDDDMLAEVLLNDRIVFVTGKKNRWGGRRKIRLSELCNESWSLPPPGSVPRSAIDHAFRAAGVDIPRATVSSPAFQVHTYLIASGRFQSIMPESVMYFSGDRLAMKVLPVDLPIRLSAVVMVILKYRTASAAAQLVMECARAVVKPLVSGQSGQQRKHPRRPELSMSETGT